MCHRHRWPDKVLLGSHHFIAAPAQLRPLIDISSASIWPKIAEILLWAGIVVTTEVAHKSLAAISPPHVSVHVGFTATTAHRSKLTQIYYLQSFSTYSTLQKQQPGTSQQGFPLELPLICDRSFASIISAMFCCPGVHILHQAVCEQSWLLHGGATHNCTAETMHFSKEIMAYLLWRLAPTISQIRLLVPTCT